MASKMMFSPGKPYCNKGLFGVLHHAAHSTHAAHTGHIRHAAAFFRNVRYHCFSSQGS
jgi:hypothetical protein